jgi:hypothetical protein
VSASPTDKLTLEISYNIVYNYDGLEFFDFIPNINKVYSQPGIKPR